MPQMTLTADEARLVREHRKRAQARLWFQRGLDAAAAKLEAMAVQTEVSAYKAAYRVAARRLLAEINPDLEVNP